VKTIKNQIKIMSLLVVLTFSINVNAQSATDNNIYVRVYDMEGKKISKGHVLFAIDTLLGLKKGNKIAKINVSDIGHIKTKRSEGHDVIKGSVIGASSMAILLAASGGPDSFWTVGEGVAAGVLLGAPAGAAIGGITALFKNSSTYIIDGDLVKWKAFSEMILK
jgi:hypothetical protein